MGNRIVIGIMVAIALILSGAGFTWFKNNSLSKVETVQSSPQTSPSAVVQASAIEETQTDTRKSLKELFAVTGNQKCTFSDTQNGSSGVIYTSLGKMRGDFTSVSKGQTVISHMIVEGQTSFVWTDGVSQGMKISIDKVSSMTASSSAMPASSTSSTPINIDQKVSYSCSAWTPDQSLLTLPSNIKFSDLSEIMPKVKSSASPDSPKSDACKLCDQLTGDQKDQCKKALSC